MIIYRPDIMYHDHITLATFHKIKTVEINTKGEIIFEKYEDRLECDHCNTSVNGDEIYCPKCGWEIIGHEIKENENDTK